MRVVVYGGSEMRKRDAYYFDDPDEVSDEVPPGHSVRLHLCDTVRFEPRPLSRLTDLSAADLDRHRPGYRLSDGEASKSTNMADLDAARAQAARERWIADMCSAWKRPPNHDASDPDAAEQLLARRLRGKPDDDGAPDPGDIRAVERRRLTERGAEAQRERDRIQRERDRIWEDYRRRISSAWQTAQTNPARATAVEQQAERWRGGR
jgi:hypothetical protein